jgi:hypothetical protein
MELQLFCHGMMLFWYRKPVGDQPHGYRIMIPQGILDEELVHELRLVLDTEAERSYLGFKDQDPATRATQYWRLEFGNAVSTSARGRKPSETNLTFYGAGSTQSIRRAGRTKGKAGVAFVIDIPYPREECPIRAMNYTNNPYLEPGMQTTGRVVKTFNAQPGRIVSARVFQFSITDAAISLYNTRTGCRREIVARPSSDIIKIHLYNQSKDPPSGKRPNHLPLLNNMLTLKTIVDNTRIEGPFDLQLNPERKGTYAELDYPTTICDLDLLDLWERSVLLAVGGELKGLEQFHPAAYDPAECGQGSGCNEPEPPDPDPEPPDPLQLARAKAVKPAAKKQKKATKKR